MTGIETITTQEFEDATNHKKKIVVGVQEELRILMDLQDGEAIKFRCKPISSEVFRENEHGKRCPWGARIRREAKKHGIHVKATCMRNPPKGPWLPNETSLSIEASGGGTMYVLRVRSISEESHAS